MKIRNLTCTFIFFFFSCDNLDFKSFYPANPPVIELKLLTASNHGGSFIGDFLLLFRSSNNKNSRFGGFLIFINPLEADILQMDTHAEASYTLGKAAVPADSIDIAQYNPANGIDVQLAILFTNSPANPGDVITVDSKSYPLTKILAPVADLVTGNYFMMRAYLWDSTNNVILEVGNPGNIVRIE
jgi:hypothetical protein